MINKFLFSNGGSETYIFNLGKELIEQGHEVQYFGMEHERNIVGNSMNAYTKKMDFHSGSKIDKLMYPVRTIYSCEARRRIRRVLDDFSPDVCHLNNFNYQLTPSIILEIGRWSKKNNHPCRIVYTAHDYQLVCPNHMCRNPLTEQNCEKCSDGRFSNCFRNKCIHKSRMRSLIGAAEASFWKLMKVYNRIDVIVCCSRFMKSKLDANPVLRTKTKVMHNFVDKAETHGAVKKDYVLYFGRYHREKGIYTLLEACRLLPHIPFVFAGSGALEDAISEIGNVKNVGFQSGRDLTQLIAQARFSVYPSEWYENCPFSVMESISLGTPVLGAQIGGIPELIREGVNGELFPSGDAEELRRSIEYMWTAYDGRLVDGKDCFDDVRTYVQKLVNDVYAG